MIEAFAIQSKDHEIFRQFEKYEIICFFSLAKNLA